MMTTNIMSDTGLLLAGVTEEQHKGLKESTVTQRYKSISQPSTSTAQPQTPVKNEYEWRIVWRNVIGMIYLHVGGLYGLYLIFTVAKFATFLFGVFLAFLAAMGVTAGAHRLWAHRTYKAHWILRVYLMVMQTVCFQNHVYEWVRDHRVHHKYTDTDADPHNSKRGFFFSHVGWLLIRKHPDVKLKGQTVDMSDLDSDPVVTFQRKTYFVLMPLLCFVIPTTISWNYLGEDWWTAWYVCGIFRYIASLHVTWLVNSAAHIYGYRPYDCTISPTENPFVGYIGMGEGWHNYHHVFPWDYKTAELPTYGRNLTLGFIDQMAKLGLAYDLKTVSKTMIAKRAARTGDGSHCPEYEEQVWGWGDRDMTDENIKYCEILYKRND